MRIVWLSFLATAACQLHIGLLSQLTTAQSLHGRLSAVDVPCSLCNDYDAACFSNTAIQLVSSRGSAAQKLCSCMTAYQREWPGVAAHQL